MTHVRGRKVYLSGPMTGIEDWNRKAFDKRAWYLGQLAVASSNGCGAK